MCDLECHVTASWYPKGQLIVAGLEPAVFGLAEDQQKIITEVLNIKVVKHSGQ